MSAIISRTQCTNPIFHVTLQLQTHSQCWLIYVKWSAIIAIAENNKQVPGNLTQLYLILLPHKHGNQTP